MNAVDRYDQRRSTYALTRRETRVPMSILSFITYVSVLNLLSLLEALSPDHYEAPSVRDMKQIIAEAFVRDQIDTAQKRVTLYHILNTIHPATGAIQTLDLRNTLQAKETAVVVPHERSTFGVHQLCKNIPEHVL